MLPSGLSPIFPTLTGSRILSKLMNQWVLNLNNMYISHCASNKMMCQTTGKCIIEVNTLIYWGQPSVDPLAHWGRVYGLWERPRRCSVSPERCKQKSQRKENLVSYPSDRKPEFISLEQERKTWMWGEETMIINQKFTGSDSSEVW